MTQLAPGPVRQKRSPMVRSKRHREFVAKHACLACCPIPWRQTEYIETCSQAAHVNYLGAKHSRPRGKGERVDDFFTVPLCVGCHGIQTARGHSGKREEAWWEFIGIDPEPICLELARNSPDPKIRKAVEPFLSDIVEKA